MPQKLSDIEQQNIVLFNMLLRQQLYVDGVKTKLTAEYIAQLRTLFTSFSRFFAENRYSTLDQLNKFQLNEFLRKFQKLQVEFYSRYNNDLANLLRDFVDADLNTSSEVFSSLNLDAPNNSIFGQAANDSEALFAKIIGEPIPANGLLVGDMLKQFSNYSNGRVLALIRQGYANGWTPSETAIAILGSSEMNFRDGLFARLAGQQSSNIATIIQHLHSNVEGAIASTFFTHYRWISVLDSRTTPICIARNGVIYEYDNGPLPPAHYNCRSTIVPDTGEDMFNVPESYYDWLKTQPASFQNDLLGASKAAKLRSGSLVEKDFTSIGTVKPLTIEDFAGKIRHILQGD